MAAEVVAVKAENNRRVAVVAEPNLVKVSGTVKDGTDILAERTVQVYRSGTSDLIMETISNATTGVFYMLFPGEVSLKCRVLAFAKKGESDERSKAFDFVNPIQHTITL